MIATIIKRDFEFSRTNKLKEVAKFLQVILLKLNELKDLSDRKVREVISKEIETLKKQSKSNMSIYDKSTINFNIAILRKYLSKRLK